LHIPDWVNQRALAEVNFAYESIAGMTSVPLDVLNRARPEAMRYQSVSQLVQKLTARASAMAALAVTLGLITPDQAGDVIRQFQERHPGIWDDAQNEVPPP
jgi:hypothetical protein